MRLLYTVYRLFCIQMLCVMLKCVVAVYCISAVVLFSDAACDVKMCGCCISAGVLYSDAACDVEKCCCCIVPK